MIVETATLLHQVQKSLQEAERTGDADLKGAAESVMSAIAVCLRHQKVRLPDELVPFADKLVK